MRNVEAYDFSVFERRMAVPKEEKKAKTPDNLISLPSKGQKKTAAKTRLHRSPLRTAAACAALLFAVGVMGSFVYGQVQLSNLAVQISAADKSLSEQQSLYTQLQMKSDAQQSLSTVEDTAKNKLGMLKIDSSQMESVEMNASDKAQVVCKSGDGLLAQLWERLCALLS
ncbi:MAG: hypothetical protein PHU79_06495 [Oscillospiraceae bacterium]|nr:hypothetical protein [Oscillospiraceae bacterium]